MIQNLHIYDYVYMLYLATHDSIHLYISWAADEDESQCPAVAAEERLLLVVVWPGAASPHLRSSAPSSGQHILGQHLGHHLGQHVGHHLGQHLGLHLTMLRYTLVLVLAAAPATLTNTDCSARPAVVPPVSQLSLRTGATINLTCHVSPPCAAAASFSWLLGSASKSCILIASEGS